MIGPVLFKGQGLGQSNVINDYSRFSRNNRVTPSIDKRPETNVEGVCRLKEETARKNLETSEASIGHPFPFGTIVCYLRTVNLTAAVNKRNRKAAVRLTVLRLVCYGRLKPS